MATFDLGRVTPLYKGDYNASTSYELNDVVLYNGNLYWHIQATATVGILPTDTTVWKLAFADEGVRAEIRGYADDAQASKTAAATSASQASASASNASASASQAASSAQAASTKASEASTSAQTASSKASEATASAQSAASEAQTATDKATLASQKAAAASASETNAVTAAQTATTKASEAAASATSAQEYDESAQASAVNAQTAQGLAETAQTAAETAQGLAEDARDEAQQIKDDVEDAIAGKADSAEIGDLSQLTTTAKNNLVSAVSEINERLTQNTWTLLNGLSVDYTVTGTGYKIIECILAEGQTYTFTNNMSAGCNLQLAKSDGTYVTVVSVVKPGASYDFTVDSDDYIGVRFYANATGSASVTGGASLLSIKNELDTTLIIDNIVLNPGYISGSGDIVNRSITDAPVYTNKIPVMPGYVFKVSLAYPSTNSMWMVYATYNADGTFIERITVDAGVQRLSHTYTVTVTNTNARYVVFMWRTHGDCTSIISTDKYNSIQCTRIDAIDSRLEIVENSVGNSATAVKSVNHRGYNTVAPENTIPAFKLSRLMGFDTVETDVAFTSDGVAVLLHDGTINRTARNADGTTISSSIDIGSLTYEQTQQYDFGIWKSAEYAGTKIPTFTEFITLCKRIGLDAYIELKPTGATEARIRGLIDAVKSVGMEDNVTWLSFYSNLLAYVKNYDSSARIGYITETVDEAAITTTNGLKTADNEVFVESDVYNASAIALCSAASLPLEVWTIDNLTNMENLDPYITGATSNSLIFGKVLYNKYIQ